MPPPDTTIYYSIGIEGDPLPRTGNAYIDSTISSHQAGSRLANKTDNNGAFDGTSFFFLLLFGFLMAVITNGVSLVPGFIQRRQLAAAIRKLVGEKGATCHELLMDCNPYYRSLPDDLKQRFVERTLHFADSKEFRYHAIEEKEYIPLLISGAAVQLTFGLQNYLMDYFSIIHITKREYLLHLDNEMYLGHVSRSGIHISWGHFLQGYHDYSDAVNLGLHEMAHALQFDAYLGPENKYDRDFKDRLKDFAEEGRPVFRAMREGLNNLFHEYSTTNFDEFWAVSVENFFENAALFKERLPVLYREMCELLNQDPLLEYKIIDPDLA